MKKRSRWKKRGAAYARTYLVYRNQQTGEVGLPWQGLVMMSLLLNGTTAMHISDIATDLFGKSVDSSHAVYHGVRSTMHVLDALGYVTAVRGRNRQDTLWLPTDKGREEFELAMAAAHGKSAGELSDSVAFLTPKEGR